MKHLRTRRKPSKKNIGNIVFAIIFVFVCMSILITVSNLVKRSPRDISYAKSNNNRENENKVNSVAVIKDNNGNGSWILDNTGLLMTKDNDEIFIQVANTALEQEIGLSGRDRLNIYKNNGQIVTEGMLFDFKKETSMSFWMKDMNFDLDMIWLDNNFKIVQIEEGAKASSYDKSNPNNSKIFSNGDNLARYVLEVDAGLVKEMNLKVGEYLIKKY